MGQLRDRMEQDLKLKRVSPATIHNYLLYCRKFPRRTRYPERRDAAISSRHLRNSSARNLPVYDALQTATFSGVPQAISSPPLWPPSGPRSMT